MVLTGDYFLQDIEKRELQELGVGLTFKPVWPEDLITLVRNLTPAAPKRGDVR